MNTESSDSAWIDDYIEKKGAKLGEVAHGVRAMVRDVVPDSVETVNPWSMPTFECGGPFCYFSIATKHITFGFYRGGVLDDPDGLLEGTGKNLRHVKVRGMEDLKSGALRDLVAAAARLNRDDPQKGMGSKKKE